MKRELSRDPCLRAELATLQREIAPLDHLSDSVKPPPGLARRTCANIWKTLNQQEPEEREPEEQERGEKECEENREGAEEQDCLPNSGIFMDSAFFAPESILPSSFLLQTSEHEDTETKEPVFKKLEHKVSRTTRSATTRSRGRFDIEEEEDDPPRPSRIGLVASVSVGIVIACFLFPLIRYAERSTRSYVTDSWRSEINRRVGQYEQIYGSSIAAPPIAGSTPYNFVPHNLAPYNLAQGDWQEVRLEDDSFAPEDFMPEWNSDGVLAAKRDTSTLDVHARKSQEYIPLGINTYKGDSPNSLDADPILLITSGQGGAVRLASGQALRFYDGRFFSRVLPDME